MKTSLIQIACIWALYITTVESRGEDAPKNIIKKAIAAAGGQKALEQLQCYQAKSRGSIVIDGTPIPFSSEYYYQHPDQTKLAMQLRFGQTTYTEIQVLNQAKGWEKVNGQTRECKEDEVRELRESSHQAQVEGLVPLLHDSQFILCYLGEATVDTRACLRVKVAARGYRDVELFFDRASGLLMKIGCLRCDRRENVVVQEIVYSAYKPIGGVQHPMTAVYFIDGKKYLESETVEFRLGNRIADSEFCKP